MNSESEDKFLRTITSISKQSSNTTIFNDNLITKARYTCGNLTARKSFGLAKKSATSIIEAQDVLQSTGITKRTMSQLISRSKVKALPTANDLNSELIERGKSYERDYKMMGTFDTFGKTSSSLVTPNVAKMQEKGTQI